MVSNQLSNLMCNFVSEVRPQLVSSPVLVDDIKVRFCSKAVSNKFIDLLSNFVLPQSDYSWPTLQYKLMISKSDFAQRR